MDDQPKPYRWIEPDLTPISTHPTVFLWFNCVFAAFVVFLQLRKLAPHFTTLPTEAKSSLALLTFLVVCWTFAAGAALERRRRTAADKKTSAADR